MTNNYNANQDLGRELDWNDVIENDSPEFILLPEGDYEFTVKSITKGRHAGSEKLPPCNKAIVALEISSIEGTVTLNHNLFLHSKCEGILCSFFICIGQRKHGEKLIMDWNKVVGAKGKCSIKIREWQNNKTGEPMKSNEIKKFIEPAANPTSAYTPGAF